MSTTSGFRYIFWGLVAMVAVVFLGLAVLAAGGHLGCCDGPFGGPAALLPLLILVALYISVVSTLTFRDASRRGMDPWLWATIATFVPHLIGVIIYLVARSSAGIVCANCGKSLRRDFDVCPHCGQSQRRACAKCGKLLASGWKLCPYCSHPTGE